MAEKNREAERLLRDFVMAFGKRSDFKDFEDGLHDGINKIVNSAAKSTIINDAYGNSLASIGTDDKVKSFSTYALITARSTGRSGWHYITTRGCFVGRSISLRRTRSTAASC